MRPTGWSWLQRGLQWRPPGQRAHLVGGWAGFAKEGAPHHGRCGPLAGEGPAGCGVEAPMDSLRQGMQQRGGTSKSPAGRGFSWKGV